MNELVIDTNVLFSALYDPDSVPGRIIELALEGAVSLYAPDTVQEELEQALGSKLGYTREEWEKTLEALPVEWIEEPLFEPALPEARQAIADPADVPVVATALVVDTAIVSGDGDFHPLEEAPVETYRPRTTLEALDPS